MSWPFCPQCGTILDEPVTESVQCTSCPFSCKFVDVMIPESITRSEPSQKPTWAQQDDEKDSSKKTLSTEKQMVQHATIDEPCPNCQNPQLLFYTMQLRSADEGSTVFYECEKCNHKFSQNN